MVRFIHEDGIECVPGEMFLELAAFELVVVGNHNVGLTELRTDWPILVQLLQELDARQRHARGEEAASGTRRSSQGRKHLTGQAGRPAGIGEPCRPDMRTS